MSEQSATVAPLLTKKDAARVLGVTERSIDNYRIAGRIRAIKFGNGAVRFDPADLRACIEEAKEVTDAE